MRPERLGHPACHEGHAVLARLVYGQVVDDEADERSRRRWVLPSHKDVAGKKRDEVHHDVKSGEASGGVEGGDVVDEGLLGGGGGEGPLGVVDEPEGHVD